MKKILVLGAGRSSSSLISYLLDYALPSGREVIVGDVSLQAASEKVNGHACGKAIVFDIRNEEASASVIAQADVVISLLPAHLHPLVAQHCLDRRKHLLNASYVSPEMKSFHDRAVKLGLTFLCECGLDPGIDHMSAMQVIDRIRREGGKLTSFESFTGGLIAPETDPGNPWRYKFTWNPRNVVMAGQGTARFLQQGRYKYIPYQQLFKRVTPVHVPGYGDYEGYANRDSLQYLETYQLKDVKTMLRGTLRNKGFCPAWDIFVQLGCCDDTYEMEGVASMTHSSFIDAFLDNDHFTSTKEKIALKFLLAANAPELQRLEWSGLFSDEPVGLTKGTPAQILEHILNKRWRLGPTDKDQIVMWHRFVFERNGASKEIQSYMIATGRNAIDTAMAQTVGLPLGIAAKLVLEEKITSRGVVIPTTPEFYDPILKELKSLGIELTEAE